jgi:Tricorn protease PDZ domain
MAAGYLRYPHIRGDLLTFVAGDDIWLAPASGGRAWRLSADDVPASSPLEAPGVAVGPGDELVAVDGQPVDPRRGPWPLLAGTAGKPTSTGTCGPR